MEEAYWTDKHFAFFCNEACEYFPCHKTDKPQEFNCLFCYCPLYALGPDCGGNPQYLENGIKDCSACMLPHGRDSYGVVSGKFQEIVGAMKKRTTDG